MKTIEGKPEIEYPCRWQYKVIGRKKEQLVNTIKEICAPVPVDITYSHASKSGKYHSMNVTIDVQDEQARDSLFTAFQNHPDITLVI